MKPPTVLRRPRWLMFILGFCFFIWLPFEDISPALALSLAMCICGLAASLAIGLFKHKNWFRGWMTAIIGAMGGFLVSFTALMLMAIKTGLHGHSAPDFSLNQILLTFNSTPLFMVSGALLGLGAFAWERGTRL